MFICNGVKNFLFIISEVDFFKEGILVQKLKIYIRLDRRIVLGISYESFPLSIMQAQNKI